MTRLIPVLLVTLLIGAQVEAVVGPHEVLCQETSDCCTPEGVCDVDCVACACCATHPGFACFVTADPIRTTPGEATPASRALTLPLVPTEVLHVPKAPLAA